MKRLEIERDRWGRPLILPESGEGKPVAYTRCSTLAKLLDDKTNLELWGKRMVVAGLVIRPDLLTRVAAVIANHADWQDDKDAKKKLNAIAKEAIEAAGGGASASQGTGLHELTEALDLGLTLPFVGKWGARLEEYRVKMSEVEVLDIETFVVNDKLQTAGSFDRLLHVPGLGVVVADLKTGLHDASFPLGVTTQIAVYANSLRYDPSGERSELHPEINLDTGLLIHMPAKGEGCRFYKLDLTKGYHAAQVAAEVQQIRKWKADDLRTELSF